MPVISWRLPIKTESPVPGVSVIVPNYNHERFLARRIESVLAQTYADFELLILDDASTDRSVEIIQRYLGDPRVRFIPREKNSGSPFPQWTEGLRQTSAPLVWIAESDDVADPALLQTLASALNNHPTAVIAYCQSHILDAEGHIVGSMADWTSDLDAQRWTSDFQADGLTECREYLSVKNTIPNASAVLFRRRAVEPAGGIPTHLRLCGDWLFWARLLQHGSLAFVAAPLNGFRKHSASVRSQTSLLAEYQECFQVRRWIRDHCGGEQAARAAKQHWWHLMHQAPQSPAWLWTCQQLRETLQTWPELTTSLTVRLLLAKSLRLPGLQHLLRARRSFLKRMKLSSAAAE